MKKVLSVFVALTALTGYGAENLLKNGNFESVLKKPHKESMFTAWRAADYSPKDKMGRISLEPHTDAVEGKICAELTSDGSGHNFIAYQTLKVIDSSGKGDYVLSFYFKASEDARIYCSVRTYKDGKRLTYIHSKPMKGNGKWQELVFPFSNKEEVDSIMVMLRSNKSGVLLDDAVLLKAGD